MQTNHLQLSPEQRDALNKSAGQPLHIADPHTQKVYVLFEQGALPELEEEYIREKLELAREQISRGEVSNASIDEIIAKAWQSQNE